MLGPARAPIDPSEVRIYRAAPPGSVDVAQLEAASGIGFGTPGQERAVIDRLRTEAAALGANGLVIVGVGQARSPVGMSVGGASYGRNSAVGVGLGIPTSRKKAHAVAIYVPPASRDVPASD
ncbi:hypothetical protein GCM10011521_07980 [Arenimonas soli]|uniref:Uncharacterized protein n=2 Tax=Arenimonas soli TaxID=2269504 RepID=A0ABQ1HEL4_9GAMM|nr:hypothetical protein GCM10011521_07980 [Arenimonas soli]